MICVTMTALWYKTLSIRNIHLSLARSGAVGVCVGRLNIIHAVLLCKLKSWSRLTEPQTVLQ